MLKNLNNNIECSDTYTQNFSSNFVDKSDSKFYNSCYTLNNNQYKKTYELVENWIKKFPINNMNTNKDCKSFIYYELIIDYLDLEINLNNESYSDLYLDKLLTYNFDFYINEVNKIARKIIRELLCVNNINQLELSSFNINAHNKTEYKIHVNNTIINYYNYSNNYNFCNNSCSSNKTYLIGLDNCVVKKINNFDKKSYLWHREYYKTCSCESKDSKTIYEKYYNPFLDTKTHYNTCYVCKKQLIYNKNKDIFIDYQEISIYKKFNSSYFKKLFNLSNESYINNFEYLNFIGNKNKSVFYTNYNSSCTIEIKLILKDQFINKLNENDIISFVGYIIPNNNINKENNMLCMLALNINLEQSKIINNSIYSLEYNINKLCIKEEECVKFNNKFLLTQENYFTKPEKNKQFKDYTYVKNNLKDIVNKLKNQNSINISVNNIIKNITLFSKEVILNKFIHNIKNYNNFSMLSIFNDNITDKLFGLIALEMSIINYDFEVYAHEANYINLVYDKIKQRKEENNNDIDTTINNYTNNNNIEYSNLKFKNDNNKNNKYVVSNINNSVLISNNIKSQISSNNNLLTSFIKSNCLIFKTKLYEKQQSKDKILLDNNNGKKNINNNEPIFLRNILNNNSNKKKTCVDNCFDNITKTFDVCLLFDNIDYQNNVINNMIKFYLIKYPNVFAIYPRLSNINSKLKNKSIKKVYDTFLETNLNKIIIFNEIHKYSELEIELFYYFINKFNSKNFDSYIANLKSNNKITKKDILKSKAHIQPAISSKDLSKNYNYTNPKTCWFFLSFDDIVNNISNNNKNKSESNLTENKLLLLEFIINYSDIILNYSKDYNTLRGGAVDDKIYNDSKENISYLSDIDKKFINNINDEFNYNCNKLYDLISYSKSIEYLKSYSIDFNDSNNNDEESLYSRFLLEEYFFEKSEVYHINSTDIFILFKYAKCLSMLRQRLIISNNYSNNKFKKEEINYEEYFNSKIILQDVILAILFFEETCCFKYSLDYNDFNDVNFNLIYNVNYQKQFSFLLMDNLNQFINNKFINNVNNKCSNDNESLLSNYFREYSLSLKTLIDNLLSIL